MQCLRASKPSQKFPVFWYLVFGSNKHVQSCPVTYGVCKQSAYQKLKTSIAAHPIEKRSLFLFKSAAEISRLDVDVVICDETEKGMASRFRPAFEIKNKRVDLDTLIIKILLRLLHLRGQRKARKCLELGSLS